MREGGGVFAGHYGNWVFPALNIRFLFIARLEQNFNILLSACAVGASRARSSA